MNTSKYFVYFILIFFIFGLELSKSQNTTKSCEMSSLDEFPKDIFSDSQNLKLISIVHFTVSIYIFCAIAILCDDYFIPSLECISNILKIPPDIAGATFMAVGGSMPELFVSLIGTKKFKIGVFITRGDIGTGTILGSSVLNVLLVVGLCGLFSSSVKFYN